MAGMNKLIIASLLVLPCLLVGADDGIKNGVHGCTHPQHYVESKDPAVKAKLEWFKDQKLCLFMCLGPYSDGGIVESWALSDGDASWSRRQVDWTKDGEAFKRQYWSLAKSFNPIRFRPDRWADIAARNGFKYVLFTCKQHDGFCLWDSKYTDFKVTGKDCAFASDPRADIVKGVFDAFRAKGIGIAAYFSKPDWHHPDYWDNCGLGIRTTRYPTYNTRKNPVRWQRFREFTRNQMLELVRDYGPIDIMWLDGGQVKSGSALDIGIEQIAAEARKITPGLIFVDRCGRNACEDVITPEQAIPERPIDVPWESCITMSPQGWGYHFDADYHPTRKLVHMLIDVVAKGGNLALDIGPRPDGELPLPAVKRMEEMGAWLKLNGQAIYATRPIAPYRKGDWAFTRGKDGSVYAIRLWKESEPLPKTLAIPCEDAAKVKQVTHLASGQAAKFAVENGLLVLTPPEGFKPNGIADAFRLGF